MIRAPVVLFGFRRSDLLRSSLEELNRIGSLRVHLVLDGAPDHSPEIQKEVSLCHEVLKSAWSALDIVPHFAEQNLGCRGRVLTGLDEVFKTEEEAIILEDDIRAGPDFFHLCNKGLELLRNDERVGSICGSALKGIHGKIRSPVFLSCYTGSWGWATWGDRWKKFRQDNLKLNVLDQPEPPSWLKMEQEEWLFWQNRIGLARSGRLDSWAYPWKAFCWQMEWLTLRPSSNLVKNLGFGPDATHTKDIPPGVVLELEQWTQPTSAEVQSPPVGIGDSILSDWIRPGANRLERRIGRFIRELR
jgi:hypothetical protein